MSKIFLWQWNPVKNIWYFLLSMKIRICKSLHFLIFVKSNFCIFSSVFVAFYSASTFNSNRYDLSHGLHMFSALVKSTCEINCLLHNIFSQIKSCVEYCASFFRCATCGNLRPFQTCHFPSSHGSLIFLTRQVKAIKPILTFFIHLMCNV